MRYDKALGENFITLNINTRNVYIRKAERFQIKRSQINHNFHHKKLKKEEQIKLEASRRMEIIKAIQKSIS